MSKAIPLNTSKNFSLAKVLAIFMVVTGHWFTDTILWIPVTFGLFIFAFSSALFTAYIYGTKVDQASFWIKKAKRLGLRFIIISIFISVVVLWQGGTLMHWHTLLHFTGLSGFLNWLQIPNRSSLGAGLWFFTLLLLFYYTYPMLANLCKKKAMALAVAVLATITALILETYVKVGHELWLTMLGFILGVPAGLYSIKCTPVYPLSLVIGGCIILLLFNLLLKTNEFNTVLIFTISIATAAWLTSVQLPEKLFSFGIQKLENYLLEIYLIHGYLFVHFTGVSTLDFLLSVLLVVSVAVLLNQIIKAIEKQVYPLGNTKND